MWSRFQRFLDWKFRSVSFSPSQQAIPHWVLPKGEVTGIDLRVEEKNWTAAVIISRFSLREFSHLEFQERSRHFLLPRAQVNTYQASGNLPEVSYELFDFKLWNGKSCGGRRSRTWKGNLIWIERQHKHVCSAVRSYFYTVLHGHHVLATSAKVLKHSLGISTDRQLISIKQFFYWC